jgi:hypothetical protein
MDKFLSIEVNNMEANELLEPSASGENDFNQIHLASAQSVMAQPDTTKPEGVAVTDGVLFLIPISFLMIWAIVVFMSEDLWTMARQSLFTIKYLHRVPCKNCQFYKSSPYLQCAVHPATALTAEAINCSDYLPQKEYW